MLPLGTPTTRQDLKIPLDLEGAALTIIAGHTIQVDIGEVNGQFFKNMNLEFTLLNRKVRERSPIEG